MAQLSTGDSNSSKEMREMMEKLRKELQASEEARRRQEMDMARLQSELAKAKQQLGCKVSVEPEPTSVIIESCFEEDSKPPDMSVVSNELEISEVEVVEDFPVEVKIEEIVIDDDIQEEPYQMDSQSVEGCSDLISTELAAKDELTTDVLPDEDEHFEDNQVGNKTIDLSQDMLMKKKDEVPLYTCLKCKKSFSREQYCKNHIKRHYFNEFLLSQSNKKGSKASQLKTSNLKTAIPNHCPLCDRTYKNIKQYRGHLASYMHLVKCGFSMKESSPAKAAKPRKVRNKAAKPTSKENPLSDKLLNTNEPENKSNNTEDLADHKYNKVTSKQKRSKSIIVCTLCNITFPSFYKLNIHKNMHLGIKPFSCDVCGRAFRRATELRRHKAYTHRVGAPILCEVCGNPFANMGTLKNHMALHRDEKPFGCAKCGKRFRRKSHLRGHLQVHESVRERPFICTVCGKRYLDKLTVRAHELSHERVLPHKCTLCDKGFKTSSNLLQHKALVHNYSEQGSSEDKESTALECKECEKTFTNQIQLDSHLIKHTIRPFLCSVCGIGFVLKSTLNAHMRIHTGDKPFSCDICKKRFTQMSCVYYHKAVHLQIKPHLCNICGKRFAFKSALESHLFIHSNQRPYSCKYCDKKFRQLPHKYNHERVVHEGIRKYSCPTCGKTFTTSGNLRQHEWTHKPEPVTCEICGKTYSNKYGLSSHIKQHKKEDCNAS